MKKLVFLLLSSAAAIAPLGAAHASGFALNEESATTQGTAFAGAAVSDEAAVMFTNPAGISQLKGDHIQIGGTLYRVDGGKFTDGGSLDLLGNPMTGNNSSNDQLLEAPSFYYTHEINDRVSVGVGVYAPFGLATTYDSGWIGRYSTIETHLNTTEISPVVSYKITDQFAVGFGPTIRYTEAKLTQAIDFGSLGVANGIPGATEQGNDGQAKIEGDGLGVGFKAGFFYQPDEDTKIGVGYRSRMTTKLGGQATYSLSSIGQAISSATGQFQNTSASTFINTPQSVDVSISHKLTEALTLYGDVMWTGWSTFKNLVISYNNTNQGETAISENWRDTVRVSIGASYDVTPDWTLRMGYSYDQSPVNDVSFTTARVPDGDRHWLTFGTGYKFSDSAQVNLAYAHIFMNSANSNNVNTNAQTLIGNWAGVGSDLFTLDFSYKF